MLTVVNSADSAPADPPVVAALGGSLIDEIVRDGARRMLAAALEAEVAAYIAAHVGEVDEHGRRLVVRNNGRAQPRQVLTSSGALREVFPATREQRYWFHKIGNVLSALPKSAHHRWRAVNAPHLVALVRADAHVERGHLVERHPRSQHQADAA